MKTNSFRTCCVLALTFCGLAAPSRADTQQYSASAPLAPTNSNRVISVPQFNPVDGDLQAVVLSLMGHVEGTARFESLNATSRTVTMNLAANIELKGPDGNAITSVLPLASMSSTVGGYDGVMDFGGASGRTFSNLSATSSSPVMVYSSPSDLAKFTGAGLVSFPLASVGASTASGPGNIVYQFTTATSAWVEVTYQYAVVPEPAALGLLGLGAMLLRRRGR